MMSLGRPTFQSHDVLPQLRRSGGPVAPPPWVPALISLGFCIAFGRRQASVFAFLLISLTYVCGVLSVHIKVQYALVFCLAAASSLLQWRRLSATRRRGQPRRAPPPTRLPPSTAAAVSSALPAAATAPGPDERDRGLLPGRYPPDRHHTGNLPPTATTAQPGPSIRASHPAAAPAGPVDPHHVPHATQRASTNAGGGGKGAAAAAGATANSTGGLAAVHFPPGRHGAGSPNAAAELEPTRRRKAPSPTIEQGVRASRGATRREERGLAAPSSPPPRHVPLTRGSLEIGRSGDVSPSDALARTAAWAAAVMAAQGSAAAGGGIRAGGADGGREGASGARPRVVGARRRRLSLDVDSAFAGYGGSEVGGGSDWSQLPLAVFSEVVRLVGDPELRSIRLCCRDWLSAASSCVTALSPPPAGSRHLDALAAAFPLLSCLDLSVGLQHITPTRIHPLAHLRHLRALVLGCPAAPSSPTTATGPPGPVGLGQQGGGGPQPGGAGGGGLRLQRPSYGAGGAAAVDDCCVRELVEVLAGGGGAGGGVVEGARGGWPSARLGLGVGAECGVGLRALCLAQCVNLSDAGIVSLARLTSLTSLDLTGCVAITDVGVMMLARLPTLASLELAWCLRVSNGGLCALAVLPSLTHLNISGCPLVNEAGVRCLASVTALRSLDLTHLGHSRVAVTDASLAALAGRLHLTQLAIGGYGGYGGIMGGAGGARVSDAGLAALGAGFPRLAAVTLLALTEVSDGGVAALAGALTGLTSLSVRGCGPGVTRRCVADVAAAAAEQRRRAGAASPGISGSGGLAELSLLYNHSLDLQDADVALLCSPPPPPPVHSAASIEARLHDAVASGGTALPSSADAEDAAGGSVGAAAAGGCCCGELQVLGLGGSLQVPAAAPLGEAAAGGDGGGGGAAVANRLGMGLASLHSVGRLTALTSLTLVGYGGTFWGPPAEAAGGIGVTASGSYGGVRLEGFVGANEAAGGCGAAAAATHSTPLTLLRRLRRLDLSGAVQLDDTLLAAVAAAATGIRTLLLPRCTAVSNAGLAAMAPRLPGLQVLNLSHCPRITCAGLSTLAPLRALAHLFLQNCPNLTDAGIAALSALRRLELLDLAHTGPRVTGAGFASFAGRRSGSRLAMLVLSHCGGLDDRGLATVCGSLRGLVRLEAAGCMALSDAGGSCLGQLPYLTAVDLSHCARIGDATLAALAPLRHLALVRLPGCVRISDEGLAALAAGQYPPPYAYHSSSGSGSSFIPLSATSVVHTAPATATTVATITTTTATAATITTTAVTITATATTAAARPPGTPPRILSLHLDSCISVSDAGLSRLALITSLTSLRLTRCAAITDVGVGALAGLSRLCGLSLAHCPEVTQGGLRALSGITSLASLEF